MDPGPPPVSGFIHLLDFYPTSPDKTSPRGLSKREDKKTDLQALCHENHQTLTSIQPMHRTKWNQFIVCLNSPGFTWHLNTHRQRARRGIGVAVGLLFHNGGESASTPRGHREAPPRRDPSYGVAHIGEGLGPQGWPPLCGVGRMRRDGKCAWACLPLRSPPGMCPHARKLEGSENGHQEQLTGLRTLTWTLARKGHLPHPQFTRPAPPTLPSPRTVVPCLCTPPPRRTGSRPSPA